MSWGMWGGGGVVVVVWWWDLHEGRPAGVFFGGGCTVVGSWGVRAVWWLGAASRGGFWRLQIWWPVSLALHCQSMHGQADWPPFRRFCSVTNFYFSKFFSGWDTKTRKKKKTKDGNVLRMPYEVSKQRACGMLQPACDQNVPKYSVK